MLKILPKWHDIILVLLDSQQSPYIRVMTLTAFCPYLLTLLRPYLFQANLQLRHTRYDKCVTSPGGRELKLESCSLQNPKQQFVFNKIYRKDS